MRPRSRYPRLISVRTRAILALGIAFAPFAVSSAGDPLPPGYASLVRLVIDARGRDVPRAEKAQVLQTAIAEYKSLLRKKDGLDEAGLLKKFQSDAAYRDDLLSYKNPYRALYSEINFLASSMISDGVFDRCNGQFDPKWLQDQSITKNILDQRSKYEANCEGAGYAGGIQFLAKSKNQDPKSAKEVMTAYPLIFSGSNTAELLRLSDIVVVDSSLRDKQNYLGKDFPPFQDPPRPKRLSALVDADYEKKLAKRKDDYLELKRTEALKAEIYDKAVVNSLKTKASLDYFFGGKSIADVKAELTALSEDSCKSCTPVRRKALIDRALNSVINDRKSDPVDHKVFTDPRNIAVNLCNRLIDAGYFNYYRGNVDLKYENGKFTQGPTKMDRLAEVPPGTPRVETPVPGFTPRTYSVEMARDNLRTIPLRPVEINATSKKKPNPKPTFKLDPNFKLNGGKFSDNTDYKKMGYGSGAAMDAAYEYSKYQKQRLAIYQSVVKNGFTNLLFLTDSLSAKSESDQGTEYTPRLDCSPGGLDRDATMIESAIAEAKGKTDEVLADLNATIKPADPKNPKAAAENRKQIEEMIKKNPTAVGQAVAERPDLASLVCDGLNRNIISDLRDKDLHTVFTWGVNIVGTALTLTGVGSGVGLELLLAGGMLASSATLTIDQHLRSEDAKELADLYRTQFRGGQSQNEYLLDMSEDQVREYQSLKVGVADVLGVGVDATGFVGSALKTGMTMGGIAKLVTAGREIEGLKETAEFQRLLHEKGALGALKEVTREKDKWRQIVRESKAIATESPEKLRSVRQLSKAETNRVRANKWDPVDYAERKTMAEEALDVKSGTLSSAKADAVYRAHKVGEGTHGYGTYTKAQLKQKRRILLDAGFNDHEVEGLLRNGVCGAEAPKIGSLEDVVKAAKKPTGFTNDQLREIGSNPDLLRAKLDELHQKFLLVDAKKKAGGCDGCSSAVKNLAEDYDEIWQAGYQMAKKKGDAALVEFKATHPKLADRTVAKSPDVSVTSETKAATESPPIPDGFNAPKRLDGQLYSNKPANFDQVHAKLPELATIAANVRDATNPVNMASIQKLISEELPRIEESIPKLEKSLGDFDELAKYEGSFKNADEAAKFTQAKALNEQRRALLADLKAKRDALVADRSKIAGFQEQWRQSVLKDPAIYVNTLKADQRGRALLSLEASAKDVAKLTQDQTERLLQTAENGLKGGKYKFDSIAETERAYQALFEISQREGVDIRHWPTLKAKLEREIHGARWEIPKKSTYLDPATDRALVVGKAEALLGRSLSEKEADALFDAHRVGRFELGKDGATQALTNSKNYTPAQLRDKTGVLRKAFDPEDATKLLREGVAGYDGAIVDVVSDARRTFPKDPKKIGEWRAKTQEKIRTKLEAEKVDPKVAKGTANSIAANIEKDADRAKALASETKRLGKSSSTSVRRKIPEKVSADLPAISNVIRSGKGGALTKNVSITPKASASARGVPKEVTDKLSVWVSRVKNDGLQETRKIPGFKDHVLHGDRAGQRSIYLNDSWRGIYVEKADGKIEFIEITNHKY